MLIKNRDIIVVGQQPWDVAIGSNCKDLALEFSKSNRVLYVNAPLDRRTKYQHKNTPEVQHRLRVINGEENGLAQVADNLWVYTPDVLIESINFIPFTSIFKIFNALNSQKFAKSIAKAISKLNFENHILFNDNDIFRSFHLKAFLKPNVSVYYSRDNMLATPYWAKHGKYLEPALIANADVCVANSVYLANYCAQYNANSHYVGQGCDFTLFKYNDDSIAVPADLKNIKGPIIGYVGAILAARLDEEILLHMAETKPDWSIILVGPEDDVFKNSRLHKLSNVHFLGPQPPSTLAAYIKGFDVCLNPQVVNALTIGNYPRKLDEYLAMGKPTIVTQTEAVSVFKEFVYIAKTKADYVTLAEKALAENNNELELARVAFANTHTWQKNAEEIYKAILTTSQN